jgi:group I intron endonuclease
MYGVIYKIENSTNGHFYIGQTKTRLSARWSKHKQDARSGKGWVLAAAIRKHGESAFSISVIEECHSQEDLNQAEIRLIAELKPHYNSCAGGGGLGSPTPQVREKIARAVRGRKASPETKKRMSEAQKGHYVAPETVAKIQASLAPRYEELRKARIEKYGSDKRVRPSRVYISPLEDVYRAAGAKTKQEKISLAARLGYQTGARKKLIGSDNPMHGKPKPAEIKNKLSELNKGEANAFFGKLHSADTRDKMRKAHASRAPVTCPHCGQSGHVNAMKRWHFDNCRSKQ